ALLPDRHGLLIRSGRPRARAGQGFGARSEGLAIAELHVVSGRIPYAAVVADREWIVPGRPDQAAGLAGAFGNGIHGLATGQGEAQMAVVVLGQVAVGSAGHHDNDELLLG